MAEGAGNAEFTVSLSEVVAEDVVLAVAYAAEVTNPVTLTTDLGALSDTVTITANTTSAILLVPITDDDIVESDETFTVTISEGATPLPAGVTIGTAATATGTITDDDVPTVNLRAVRDVTEGAAQLRFRIDLNTDLTGDITLSWRVSGGTASAADFDDRYADTGTATIQSGRRTVPIDFAPIIDGVTEGDETLELTISNPPSGVQIGTATATGTISNSDAVAVNIGDKSVAENGGSVDFTVSLSRAVDSDLVFDVIYEGSGDNPVELARDLGAGRPPTVTIEEGRTEATITVPINNDALVEGDETFVVRLRERMANPLPDDVIIDDGSAIGTIVDNETGQVTLGPAELTANENGEFTYTVSLSRPADDAVIVRWTASAGPGDTATVDDDLRETTGTVTFAARNNTAQEFIIRPVDDPDDEDNETFTVTLEVDTEGNNPLPTGITIGTNNSSTATITDNDDTPAAVAPQITTQPTDQSVTVGENATFTVVATGTPTPTYQWRFDGSDISGATSATYTLSNAALTNAGDYTVVVTNTAASVTSSAATLTVTPAAVAPQITTQPTDQSVTVGENATFTVAATGTPTPTYQWRFDGTDISGATSATYTLSNAALTNAGDYTVVVTNTAGDVTSNAATLTVTAVAPTTVTISIANGLASEGNDISFPVTLSAQLLEARTLNITYAGVTADLDADLESSPPATLTLPTGTTTVNLVVPTFEDRLTEPNETFTVTLSVPDPLPDDPMNTLTITTATATGTIDDDDSANITIDDQTKAENEDFRIRITTAGARNSEPVNITWTVTSGTTNGGSVDDDLDLSSSTGTGSITLPASVGENRAEVFLDIPIDDDDINENDETFTLALTANGTAPRGVFFGTSSSAVLTITDNDDPTAAPDLTVDSVSVSSASVVEGASFTINATVNNGGDAASAATTLTWYRSADATITTGDASIALDAVDALAANGSSPENASVSIATAGTYWVGACVPTVSGESNTNNNCSTGVEVTVTAPPATAVPDLTVDSVSVSSASVVAGASFTINATVNNGGDGASAATTLTWYRSTDATITTGDTSIATDPVGALAASGSSPENASVSIATAGTYWVGACVPTVSGETNTNNNCSTGVQVVVTAAAVAPQITTQPTNQSVTVGGSATFTVVATGTPTPTYQWRKDGSAISGATSATYTISSTALTDAGEYTVVVTNSASAVTSTAATLTVTAAPPATAPDLTVGSVSVSSASVVAGASFTINATVNNGGDGASAATTLTWYRSTDATITTGDTSIATDPVGALAASGSSPENASVSIATAGTYWVGACVPTVSGESNTNNNCSTGVQVTVTAPPATAVPDLTVDSVSVSSASVVAGASFTINATVNNGGDAASAATTLTWYRSADVTITTGDTSIATDPVGALAASGSSPENASVSIATAGTYWVGACVPTVSGETNTNNNCSTGVQVVVTAAAVAPQITTQPTNQSVTVGASATFTVAATGTPTPAYQWRKDGTAISGATSATYTISGAALTDAGSYTVVVTNTAGNVTSTAATLTVTLAAVAPAITTQPVNQSVTVGDSATFTVAASGTPTPAYQWRKDGTAISGATSATYTISGAALTDAGSYTVVVTNTAGNVTSTAATLTVTLAAVAPAITTQPVNQSVTVGDSATFTVAATGTPTPTYQWRKDGSDISGATSATYTISGAAEADAGSYTVVATNTVGTVTSTAATLTVTPAAVAPEPPVLTGPRLIGAGTALRRHAGRFDSLTGTVARNRLEARQTRRLSGSKDLGSGAVAVGGSFDQGRWSAWIDGAWAGFGGNASGRQADVYGGVDYLAPGNGALIGALIGYEAADLEIGKAAYRAGYTHFGVYGGARLSERLLFDGAATNGTATPDIALGGVSASYDASRLTVRGALTGDFGFEYGSVRVEPQLGLLYARETLGAFTDSAGGVAGRETLELGRFSAGPRLTWGFDSGRLTGGARMQWDFLELEDGVDGRVSGAAHIGVTLDLTPRVTLGVQGDVDGIGVSEEFRSLGGKVELGVRF